VNIVVVKGRPGERDRMWVTRSDGSTDQVPINMVHDLPHLVVESAFGLEFGFWGLIDAGAFSREIEASHARDAKRSEAGRHGILMGRAAQSPLADEQLDPLVAEHEEELIAAKALTNAFRGPGDVREQLAAAAAGNEIVREKIATLDDETIDRIRSELREAEAEWRAVPAGGRLELRWPTSRPSAS